jgi:Putative adhesin
MNALLQLKGMLFCLLLGSTLTAQTTLQVVSKHIRKTLEWKPEYELVINCEKAEVVIEPHEIASIQIEAELSTRHPSADTAKFDLENWQMLTQKLDKKLYIRAYIAISNEQKVPTSNYKAKIVIRAPRNCKVELSNKFGQAKVSDIAGDVLLNGSFCNFYLADLSGKVKVKSQYGSVNTRQTSGALALNVKRTNIQIDTALGDCAIKAEYGTITINNTSQMANLLVQGNKSDVILMNIGSLGHGFDLTSEHGQITAPPDFERNILNTKQHASKAAKADFSKNRVDITTSFGNIILTQ